MKKIFLYGLCALLLLSGCAPGAPEETDLPETAAPDDGKIEIIADTAFEQGFICKGSAHADGVVGTLTGVSRGDPVWEIAQWACRYDISKGEALEASREGYGYFTPSQRVSVSYASGDPLLTLELKASLEYDSPRQDGQSWPHLLIEQPFLERCPYLDEITALNLKMRSRIAYFAEMENADPGLHAAQVTLFFTVVNQEIGDMFWFGVPVFDNRNAVIGPYMAPDAGQSGASGKFIYTVAQWEFTAGTAHDLEILDYETDLLPYIAQGLAEAVSRGYLPENDLAGYRLTSCNLGFEMPGSYDAAFELYELSLTAEK